MPIVTKTKSLETTISRLSFASTVEAENLSAVEVTLFESTPRQELPPGMTVERCRAIVLSVRNTAPVSHLAFECCVENPALTASACHGQGLVAQEWDANGRMVVVGTEDEFLLNLRLRFFESEEDAIFTCTAHKILVELRDIPSDQDLSLHFVLAENPDPEPVDASAWYAVDCPHNLVS